MAFSVQGLMAIITEWLRRDCADSVERIISIMQGCILPPREKS